MREIVQCRKCKVSLLFPLTLPFVHRNCIITVVILPSNLLSAAFSHQLKLQCNVPLPNQLLQPLGARPSNSRATLDLPDCPNCTSRKLLSLNVSASSLVSANRTFFTLPLGITRYHCPQLFNHPSVNHCPQIRPIMHLEGFCLLDTQRFTRRSVRNRDSILYPLTSYAKAKFVMIPFESLFGMTDSDYA